MRLVVLVMLLSGCSMVFMDRAPRRDPLIRPIPCSTSRAAPIADTVFAIGAAALSAKIFYEVEQTPDSEKSGLASPVIILVPLVLLPMLLAHGGSAIAGYTAAARCERFRDTPAPAPFTLLRTEPVLLPGA